MRQLPPITLEQFTGMCKGVLVTQPLDWVIAHTEKRGALRVGLVGKQEGATLRFVRILDPEMRDEIRKRVAELRKEHGGNGISPFTSSVPDPRLINAYLKGERFRKRPTVSRILMPDGTPAGTKGKS